MLHDTRNALWNVWFWASAGVALAVLVQPVYDEFVPLYWRKSTMDYLSIIASARAFGIIGPYATIFAIVPYAASIVGEARSGYMKYALLRMRRKEYALQKIVSAAVSGALALMIPFSILFFGAVLKGSPIEAGACPEFYVFTVWEEIIRNFGGFPVLAGKIVLSGLFGAIWAMVGLGCACVSNNRFVAVVMPFVWYQAAWTLCSESLYCPIHMLSADDVDLPSLGVVLAIDVLAIAALYALCHWAIRWRCRHV